MIMATTPLVLNQGTQFGAVMASIPSHVKQVELMLVTNPPIIIYSGQHSRQPSQRARGETSGWEIQREEQYISRSLYYS